MRCEPIFNQDGYYQFIVKNNVLGHQEAATYAAESLRKRFLPASGALRVLDLACGGDPVTVAALCRQFPQTKFDYTGIDINADQVAALRAYQGFPQNVAAVHVVQGNAWTPQLAGLTGTYDIVFSGLNFHHAVPEELYFLATQIRPLLADGGMVINHDIYRPSGETYLRRPEHDPENTAESFRMVPQLILDDAHAPALGIDGDTFGNHVSDWRETWLARYRELLESLDADPDGTEDILRHNYRRDFPVSLGEMAVIWQSAGYTAHTYDFCHSQHPLSAYLGVMVFHPSGHSG